MLPHATIFVLAVDTSCGFMTWKAVQHQFQKSRQSVFHAMQLFRQAHPLVRHVDGLTTIPAPIRHLHDYRFFQFYRSA